MNGTTSGCCASMQALGLDCTTLNQNLGDALKAKHLLLIGGQPVTVRVGAGDLTRDVQYTKAEIGNLNAYIAELKTWSDMCCGTCYGGRRPIRPFF